MIRYTLAIGAALFSLTSAQASTVAKHPVHRAPVHHVAPRTSFHRSTPHRVTVHRPPVKSTMHQTVTTRPATRTYQKNTTVSKNVVVNTTINRFSTRSYSRRHHRNPYLMSKYSVVSSRGMWRSSRYSRRHVRRGNGNQANVVRGVVNNTTGAADNGSIQIKVVNGNTNRFQYGVAVTAPNNAPTQTFQVGNQTRYLKVTSAQGATKASTFKDVAPGEAVVILTPRGNANAQTVEIFPLK